MACTHAPGDRVKAAGEDCRGHAIQGEDNRMRILLIEDDRKTSDYVVRGFSEAGHVCDAVADGEGGLFQAMHERYDVLIVDRMLPGLDGLSMVKALRSAGRKTPVLFLTSVGGIDDRVEGLEAGGDDYLVKPFAFSELLARANALARRPAGRLGADDAPGRRPDDGSGAPARDAGRARRSSCSRASSPCSRC